jgi:hypothetical protein
MKLPRKCNLYLRLIPAACLVSMAWYSSVPLGFSKDTTAYSTGIKGMPKGQESDAVHDPNFVKCGQDCYYQRAIENLSLQLHYYRTKTDQLLGDKLDRNDKITLLGNTCTEEEISGNDDDDEDEDNTPQEDPLKKCIDRFLKANQFWVVKVRTALKNNQEAKAQLHCAQNPDKPECTEGAHGLDIEQEAREGDDKRKSQDTYLTKTSQMGSVRKNYEQLKKVAEGGSNEKWLSNLINDDVPMKDYEPRKEDFFKFVKGADGTEVAKEDPEAFEKAKKAWLALVSMEHMNVLMEKKTYAETKKQNAKEFDEQFKEKGGGVFRDVFSESHDNYVDQFNNVKWGNVKEKKYPDKNKKKDDSKEEDDKKDAANKSASTNQAQQLEAATKGTEKATGEKDIKEQKEKGSRYMHYRPDQIKIHPEPKPDNVQPDALDIYF